MKPTNNKLSSMEMNIFSLWAIFPQQQSGDQQQRGNSTEKLMVYIPIISNHYFSFSYQFITFMQLSRRIPKQQKPRVIFILGGPGSGKGTQSKLIQTQFGFAHMSAGQLLRQQRQNPASENGKLIEKYMVQGTIVPCQITAKLLEAEMNRQGFEDGKFLIDGFPRNFQNLRRWHLNMHPDVVVPFIVVLHCGQACMTERLLNRAKTSGRVDDKIEVIKKRFHTYNNETQPVINYFLKHNKALIINAQQSVETTFDDIMHKIKQKLREN